MAGIAENTAAENKGRKQRGVRDDGVEEEESSSLQTRNSPMVQRARDRSIATSSFALL